VGDVCGKAEEAMAFYASVFPSSGIGDLDRYGADELPDEEGSVKHATFRVAALEKTYDGR
jgi:predicted 3-demethylubiquinone-9 3-methyltransferase (glyoxalase superfamily)